MYIQKQRASFVNQTKYIVRKLRVDINIDVLKSLDSAELRFPQKTLDLTNPKSSKKNRITEQRYY